MPAICVMSVWMLRSLLISRGWRRELLVAYMLIGAIPVLVAFSKATSMPMPKSYRSATFEQYLKMRPQQVRDIARDHYLVDMYPTVNVLGVPLMRKFIDEQ